LENFPIKHRKQYDFVTASDLVTNNFETEKIFEEMLLSLRNGGIMIFTTKFSYLGNYWYTEALEKLEKSGRVQALGCSQFFQFAEMKQSVGKFTKTPVKIFAYRKTEEDSVRAYALQNMKLKIEQKLQQELKKKFSNMSLSTNNSDTSS